MASNPFYPGHTPRDDPQNPFYPGYYPGEPIQRPAPFRPPPPPEYNFNIVNDFVDQLSFDVSGLPRWIKDQFVDDFKRQLKVAASPKRMNYDVQRAIELGDINETPGVALVLSINPQDWLADPGKQLKKTFSAWTKAIINQVDLENYVEKKYFWEPLIRGEKHLGGFSGISDFSKNLAYAGQKPLPGTIAGTEITPFQLTGLGIKRIDVGPPVTTFGVGRPTVRKETDVYENAGSAFLNFIENDENSVTRTDAYARLRLGAAVAIDTELKNYLSTLGTGVSSEHTRDIENFSIMVQVAESMRDVRAGATGEGGLKEASNKLSVLFIEGRKARKDGQPFTATMVLDEIYKDSAVPNNRGGFVGQALDQLDRLQAGLDLKSHGVYARAADLEAANLFKQRTKEFRKNLQELRDLVERNRRNIDPVTDVFIDKTVCGLLKGRVDAIKDNFSKVGYIKGFEDRFLESVVGRTVSEGASPLKKASLTTVGTPQFGTVMRNAEAWAKSINPATGLPNSATGLPNIKRVLNVAQREFERNDIEDLFTQLEKGTIMETYFWSVVRRYLNGFTPASWIGTQLEKTHYFGLAYNTVAADRNMRLYGMDPFSKLPWTPKNTFKIDYLGRKIKLNGGDHFKGADMLFKNLEAGRLWADVETVRNAKGIAIAKNIRGFTRNDGKGMVSFLNWCDAPEATRNVKLGAHGIAISGALGGGFDRAMGKYAGFRNWLLAENTRLGLGLAVDASGRLAETGQNAEKILALVKKLGSRQADSYSIDILMERAGALQILSSYANYAQTQYIKTVGKILSPYIQFKNAVVEAISEGLNQLISAGLAAATAGISVALQPIIDGILRILKPLLKFIINRVYSKMEAVFSAVLKGDLSKLFRDWEKDFNKLSKTVMYVALIPVGCLFIIFMLFGVLISGISAVPRFPLPGLPITGGAGGGGQANLNGGKAATPQPSSLTNATACPLNSGYITTGSFSQDSSGHGSTSYWTSVGNACTFTIPYIADTGSGECPSGGSSACAPKDYSSNICNELNGGKGVKPQQNYYGYAIDAQSNNLTVYLPKIGDNKNGYVESWTISGRVTIHNGAWGYGTIITGSNDRDIYKLYLGHLDGFWIDDGASQPTGSALAAMYTGWGRSRAHIHLEVTKNGVPYKPEDLSICR